MSTKKIIECTACGEKIEQFQNPIPTVDIIIEVNGRIVLIKRKNPPHGWAIPGGFVDYGESVEEAAIREAKEETTLDITIIGLLGVYSQPARDPRFHTISTVFVAVAGGHPKAGDDAAECAFFDRETLPAELAFDHNEILGDYFLWRELSEGCTEGSATNGQ